MQKIASFCCFVYPVKLYIRHLPNLVMLPVSLGMNLLIWLWLFWNIRPQEDPIFLHYSVLSGVDLTGPWYHIFALPTVGLVIIVLNAALGWFFFESDKYMNHALQAASVCVHGFLLIAAWLLVFLNV